MTRTLRLGTRGSPLALAQARLVARMLESQDSDIRIEIDEIVTEGDEGPPSTPPPRRGAKALFTSRIEEALLAGRVDVAVHSMKDLPADPVEGLTIGAVPVREEARDVLVTPDGTGLDRMPEAFRVGTGSLRRAAQLRAARPDVVIEPVRGNVDTRVAKMRDNGFDALVLAAAGLRRLGREDLATRLLPLEIMLPAPGQGALAVQIRTDDERAGTLVATIDDPASRTAVEAEREVSRSLGGDCNVPLGAFAEPADGGLVLTACVARPDGTRLLRKSAEGTATDPHALGTLVARRLIDDGAETILQEARNA